MNRDLFFVFFALDFYCGGKKKDGKESKHGATRWSGARRSKCRIFRNFFFVVVVVACIVFSFNDRGLNVGMHHGCVYNDCGGLKIDCCIVITSLCLW